MCQDLLIVVSGAGREIARHTRLLNPEGASPRETGLFPVHARWCPRGSRKGA